MQYLQRLPVYLIKIDRGSSSALTRWMTTQC
ncbi:MULTISPECIES: hypothetical protein [Pseudomonas]|nr:MULTISPECIES: hypothetical protein [Pseudomonas]